MMGREKIKVLFVCIHNSSRSQMAEAFLNTLGENRFVAQSAGIDPGTLNPLVVEVMHEKGIDISGNRCKSVTEFLVNKDRFDYVITVCDETSAERCPYFPGVVERIHWGFKDPSQFPGTREEKLKKIRQVRDEIKQKINSWIHGFNRPSKSNQKAK